MQCPTDWETDRDVALVRLLASAIVSLEDVDDLDSFSLPYPPEAQMALNHTALASLRQGAQPPRSMPELLDWCRTRPLASWLVNLPVDAAGPYDRLLDEETGLPTELVREWWVYRGHGSEHLYAQNVVRWALRRCRQLGPECYTAFRRLLAERPVLTHTEWFAVISDPVMVELRDLLGNIYQDVPSSYLRPGRGCAECQHCGTLLTPVAEADWWCERDACRSRTPVPPIGRIIEPKQCVGLVQLDRLLKQFVTWPGRATLQLEAQLKSLGVTVNMWPPNDAYTLRATFPDGHIWDLDVKDRAHPGLLGRTATPVYAESPQHDNFWLVPEHRLDHRADYLTVFHRNRPPAAGGLRLLSVEEAIRDAALRRRQTTSRPSAPSTDTGADGGGDARA